MGLGGAFIAVADDATAALTNPAGLMLLTRPEFFTEVRDIVADDSTETQTIFSADISASTSPSAVFSPSFISFVYPFERFALGFSRVELNKSSNSTSNQFLLVFDPNNPSAFYEFGGQGRIETDLAAYNVTGAIKITDKLSFGATVAMGVLNMKAGVANYFTDPGFISDPNIVQNPTFLLYQTAIDDTDTDVTFNAGVHWQPFEKVSFGAVYRGGMEFEVDEAILNEQVLASPYIFGRTLSSITGTPLTTTFNTPETYGAGVAWRPIDRLTVSADWVHIHYSDLLDGFQQGVNVLTLFDVDPDSSNDGDARFTIEDADEWHIGAEYVFSVGTIPWAVRAGAFSDHNSRIYGDFGGNGFSFFSTSDTFPERDTEIHYTIGTGVVVKETFQIDAAADISGIASEYVLSTIFRF